MTEPTYFRPPNESYPPPQPPYEPYPPQPQPANRRSPRWWITVVVVIVAAAVSVALILTLTGGSSGNPGRYGRRAVDVIHELHLCDHPEVLSDSTASCQFQDVPGGVAVSTSSNETEQNFLVSMVKDTMSGCTVVVKGYLIDAPTPDMLTRAIGIPEAFASKHHGYLAGRCN